ncbi:flippase-like domain-containing protein [bacterium]|nr:flippase-like domain-containing protein [bacterium]
MNWKFLLGIAVSVLFLFLAVYKANFGELVSAFQKANYIYVIPAMVLGILSVWIRAVRWNILMRPLKRIKIRTLFSATMIGFMANNLFPARLGEFVRAYVIGEKEKISKSASFATIVMERIFDGLVIISFLVVIVIFFPISLPGWLKNVVFFTVGFYCAAILFLVFLKVKTDKALSMAAFISRPLPGKVRSKLDKILDSFIQGLQILHRPKDILIASLLSFLVWIPPSLAIACLLLSFDIPLPLYASFLLQIIICLGVMIPSAPGYVGIIQYCSVLGLGLFGIHKSDALSFSFLLHVSQYISITGVGFICVLIEGFSFGQMKRSVKNMDIKIE